MMLKSFKHNSCLDNVYFTYYRGMVNDLSRMINEDGENQFLTFVWCINLLAADDILSNNLLRKKYKVSKTTYVVPARELFKGDDREMWEALVDYRQHYMNYGNIGLNRKVAVVLKYWERVTEFMHCVGIPSYVYQDFRVEYIKKPIPTCDLEIFKDGSYTYRIISRLNYFDDKAEFYVCLNNDYELDASYILVVSKHLQNDHTNYIFKSIIPKYYTSADRLPVLKVTDNPRNALADIKLHKVDIPEFIPAIVHPKLQANICLSEFSKKSFTRRVVKNIIHQDSLAKFYIRRSIAMKDEAYCICVLSREVTDLDLFNSRTNVDANWFLSGMRMPTLCLVNSIDEIGDVHNFAEVVVDV